MPNELADSQRKRFDVIKSSCEEILRLERDKCSHRADLERLRADISIGVKSNAKLNPTEEQQSWSAGIGKAKNSEALIEAELEKIKEQQNKLLKRIEGVVNL